MSATNATPTISLPLFIGTDKPAWLTDWNGAMNTVDSAIATLQTAEAGTATSLATLSQSVEALSGTVSQHTTSITTISTAVAGNTGSINTINSLIGNGEPTTEDKTIIGAINEIYSEIGGGSGVEAEDVVYDNTTSGLTAANVQAAIDEVNAKIPASGAVDADDVSYDNTTSGLTATNVQAAIDELAQDSDTYEVVGTYSAAQTDVPYDFTGVKEIYVSLVNPTTNELLQVSCYPFSLIKSITGALSVELFITNSRVSGTFTYVDDTKFNVGAAHLTSDTNVRITVKK